MLCTKTEGPVENFSQGGDDKQPTVLLPLRLLTTSPSLEKRNSTPLFDQTASTDAQSKGRTPAKPLEVLPLQKLNLTAHQSADAAVSNRTPLHSSKVSGTFSGAGRVGFEPMTIPNQPYIPFVSEPPQVSATGRRQRLVSKLDPRSWLEVADRKHRYAKHLRTYFQAWDLLGRPCVSTETAAEEKCVLSEVPHSEGRGASERFFAWLDASGYELERCPRAVLESDTVHYCASPNETDSFALRLDKGVGQSGGVTWRHAGSGDVVETGRKGWIFVLREGVFYAAPKRTEPPRFHHSSFFAGSSVEVAGMLVVRQGKLRRVYPHSGHYRPGDRHISFLLSFLAGSECGVDLASIEVDGQHTMKVARLLCHPTSSGGSHGGVDPKQKAVKAKKTDRPHWMRGDVMRSFLERKGASTSVFRELLKSSGSGEGSARGVDRGTAERQGMEKPPREPSQQAAEAAQPSSAPEAQAVANSPSLASEESPEEGPVFHAPAAGQCLTTPGPRAIRGRTATSCDSSHSSSDLRALYLGTPLADPATCDAVVRAFQVTPGAGEASRQIRREAGESLWGAGEEAVLIGQRGHVGSSDESASMGEGVADHECGEWENESCTEASRSPPGGSPGEHYLDRGTGLLQSLDLAGRLRLA